MAKIKKKDIYKNLFFYLAILLLVLSFVFIFNKKFGSFSKGDIYFSRLKFSPSESQKNTSQLLLIKENKTVEDWLELAKIQSSLGQKQEALDSISEAKKMDPIRNDIEKLYFSISQ